MSNDSRFARQLTTLAAFTLLTLIIAGCADDSGSESDQNGGESTDDTAVETVTPDDSSAEAGESPTPELTEDSDPTPSEESTPSPPEEEEEESAETPSAETDAEDLSPQLADLDLELEPFVEGLISPTDMIPATDGTDRLFVVSRIGTIHVIEDGELRDEPLLDLRDRVEFEMVEQGLLSMALHPNFAENGYLYVNYTSVYADNTIVSRFQMTDDGERAVRESEKIILDIAQPHHSHNGGNIRFGPDGYLYVGMGDGEDPGDPNENAQDPDTLLGAILRIDVDSGDPYGIPEDNPFVGGDEGKDEVWSYGFRNPWRFSFDPETGDLYIVDVGQWAVEEINVQPADSTGGENYGWPIMEGDQCWEADECDTEGMTMPEVTLSNPDRGCAIIGGYSYYGSDIPAMEGVYLFADWCTGNIRGMVREDDEWTSGVLLETDLMINSFGIDHDGEIYVLDFEEGGGIYKIVPEDSAGSS